LKRSHSTILLKNVKSVKQDRRLEVDSEGSSLSQQYEADITHTSYHSN